MKVEIYELNHKMTLNKTTPENYIDHFSKENIGQNGEFKKERLMIIKKKYFNTLYAEFKTTAINNLQLDGHEIVSIEEDKNSDKLIVIESKKQFAFLGLNSEGAKVLEEEFTKNLRKEIKQLQIENRNLLNDNAKANFDNTHMKTEISIFNSAPWYKKIFWRFD